MAQSYEQNLYTSYLNQIRQGHYADITPSGDQEKAILGRALRRAAEIAVANSLQNKYDNKLMQEYSKHYGVVKTDGSMGSYSFGLMGGGSYNSNTPKLDKDKDGTVEGSDVVHFGGKAFVDGLVNARAVAVAVAGTMDNLSVGNTTSPKVNVAAAKAGLTRTQGNLESEFDYKPDNIDRKIFRRGAGQGLPVVPGPSATEKTSKATLVQRAQRNDAEAARELAQKLYDGEGKLYEKDPVKAKGWLEKAAALGNAEAMADIGAYLYEGSHGYTEDNKKSAEWDLKAAKAGSTAGQFNVGYDYLNGAGVTKNAMLGYAWSLLAKKNGRDDTDDQIAEGKAALTPAQRKAAEAAVAAWKPGQDVADLIKAPARAQAAGPKTGAAGGALDIGDISKLTLLEKQQIQYDLEIMGLSTNQPKPFTVATPVSELDGNFGSGTRKSAAAYMKDNGFKTILEAREKLHKDATAKIEAAKPSPAPKPDLKAQLAPIIAKLSGDEKPINFFEDARIKPEIEIGDFTPAQIAQDIKSIVLKDLNLAASLTAAGVKAEEAAKVVATFSVNEKDGTVKSDFLKALGDADGILDSKDKALLKDADALKAIAAAINNGTLTVANDPAAPKPVADASLKTKSGSALG